MREIEDELDTRYTPANCIKSIQTRKCKKAPQLATRAPKTDN